MGCCLQYYERHFEKTLRGTFQASLLFTIQGLSTDGSQAGSKFRFSAFDFRNFLIPTVLFVVSNTQWARARILRNSGRRTAVRAGTCAAAGAGGPATRPGPLLDLCHHNRICMLLITQVQWSPSLLDSEVFLFQLAVALNSSESGESGTLTLCLIIWPWLTLLL